MLLSTALVHADWKQDVGYDRLTATFTTGVPTAVSAGVTQVEAGTTPTDTTPSNNYLPDSANAQFTGKTINNLSPGTGTSGHATGVGTYFYGSASSLIPGTTQIDAYSANDWSSRLPYNESRRVQNHSWIGTAFSEGTDINSAVTSYNNVIDYMADTYGTIVVVGVGNDYSTTLPYLLCQGYNQLSVGRVDGNHSAGLTAYDGSGRMKPDIVSFETVTSNTTPQVASAAGLLTQKFKTAFQAD